MNSHNLKILLAEDNEVNQVLAIRVLHKIGYKPDIANNGLEALELIKVNNYDIIFMDIEMPLMNGFEATTEIIKTYQQENRPKIIAMTAHSSPEDRVKCLKAGIDDFVSKPFLKENVQQVLNKWGKLLGS